MGRPKHDLGKLVVDLAEAVEPGFGELCVATDGAGVLLAATLKIKSDTAALAALQGELAQAKADIAMYRREHAEYVRAETENAALRAERDKLSDALDMAKYVLPAGFTIDAEHNLHECIEELARARLDLIESLAAAKSDLAALRTTCAGLRCALSDAIESVTAYGPPRCAGTYMIYSPQIGEKQVERWRDLLENKTDG